MTIELLTEFVASHPKLLVLSGAGLSTESGIGDYRDNEGVYKRPPPMTISEFVGSAAARQRYWARSLFGWPPFAAARPNQGHLSLASLQARGYLGGGLITQNVDDLHQQAGHRDVVALHGRLRWVLCMQCQARSPRVEFQQALLRANPQLAQSAAQGLVTLLPDGDAQLDERKIAAFSVPGCSVCGGVLKPDVVFFGDAVSKACVTNCYEMVAAADALLIVGSSVMIFSSFRFCRAAQQAGIPLAAVNVGKTRADAWLEFKLAKASGVTLAQVASELGC